MTIPTDITQSPSLTLAARQTPHPSQDAGTMIPITGAEITPPADFLPIEIDHSTPFAAPHLAGEAEDILAKHGRMRPAPRLPSLPFYAAPGSVKLVGETDFEQDLSLAPALDSASEALRAKIEDFSRHQALAAAAAVWLTQLGVSAKTAGNGKWAQVIITPDENSPHWLGKKAFELARQNHALVFDTLDHVAHRAMHLPLNLPEFGLPINMPFVSVSWANLLSDEPTPVAIHEFHHFEAATAENAPVQLRLCEPAQDPNERGLLSLMMGAYAGPHGHDIDEFRAYAAMAEAYDARSAALLEKMKARQNIDAATVEEQLDKILIELAAAERSCSKVMQFTHYEQGPLTAFAKESQRIEIGVVPSESAKGGRDRIFTLKPHGKEHIDLHVGYAIRLYAKDLEDDGVDRTFDTAFLVQKVQSVLVEITDVQNNVQELKKRIQAKRDEAFKIWQAALAELDTKTLGAKIAATVAALREASPRHVGREIREVSENKLYILGQAYLKKIGVNYVTYEALFRYKQLRILPEGTHWLNRFAKRLEESTSARWLNQFAARLSEAWASRDPLFRYPGKKVTFNSSSPTHKQTEFYDEIWLPWENMLADAATIESRAGIFAHETRRIEAAVAGSGTYAISSNKAWPYSLWGTKRPNLTVKIKLAGQDRDKELRSNAVHVEIFEARNYALAAERARDVVQKGSQSVAKDDALALAKKALEKTAAAAETLETIIAGIENANELLRDAIAEEARRKPKPELVEPEPEPLSDQEMANRHVAEDILHLFELMDEASGSKPIRQKPLLTSGHVHLPGGLVSIDFHPSMVNAHHNEIPAEWAGNDYRYITNEAERDWSLKPAAVLELFEFVLGPLLENRAELRLISERAHAVLAEFVPLRERLRVV